MKKKTRFSELVGKHGDLASKAEPEVAEASPEAEPTLSVAKAKGRPPGKKSDPDFTQVTVYLRKDSYATARKILFDEHKQFSDLVGELLNRWIEEVQTSTTSTV